jgi:hypothetical protein
MPRIRHVASALAAMFFLLGVSARAQTPSVSTVNLSPDADKVRISAVGDVLDMSVAVSDEAGDMVFESGPVTGSTLDWTMSGAQGARVPAGVYTMTVAYRTASGKLRRRVEQVFVAEMVTTGDAQGQSSASPSPTAVGTIAGEGAANRVAKFTGANSIGNSIITEAGGRVGLGITAPAQGLHVFGVSSRLRLQSTGGGVLTGTEHVTNNRVWLTGAGASAAPGGVANKFFVLDQTANQFRLAIDAAGNVGIGATAPTSKLTVNGDIQILGAGHGIKFPDGTIQTTKAGSGSGSSLTGTGSAGSLVKFTGASSLTNSVIKESGGKVGVGTAAPAEKLHLNGTRSVLRLQSTAANQWSATDYVTDARSWHTGVGGSQVPNDLKGKFYVYDVTAQQIRMVIDTAGNVGIGTTSPIAKLFVNGSNSTGIRSYSNYDAGVIGSSNTGTGVSGSSSSGFGVAGSSTSGFAGFFQGKVKITEGGLEVAAGGCVGCSPPSDRHLKANFSAVNPRLILDRLATIPVQTWNYKSEPESVRHIGPMAQDFRAAFQLGTDEKTLNTVDAQGVTMAAIQGLYQQNQELTRRVEQLQSQVTELRRAVNKRPGRRR